MKKVFQELPQWIFNMDEVSAGVYEIVGRDSYGHFISVKGVDLDKLIEECKQQAVKASNA